MGGQNIELMYKFKYLGIELIDKFKYLGRTLENTGGWRNQKASIKPKAIKH
jgi:hypothetical protein